MVVFHCILKNLHNFIYMSDGNGLMICEMGAHIMLLFSRITVITILIAFAFGWQVVYENTMEMKKNVQWIYMGALGLAAYDDFCLAEWI